MTEICCEHCLDEFETESDSDEPVICPFCKRNIKKDDNEFDE